MDSLTRTARPDGTVVLGDGRCAIELARPAAGIVHVRITGHDRGTLAGAPFEELRGDVARYAPLQLFIDVSGAVGAAVPVQDAWAEWFAANRRGLSAVHILAPGSYLSFTAEVMKLYSRTGELIRVYLDPTAFAEALRQATGP